MAPSWVSSPLFTNIIIALSINIIIVSLFPTLPNLVKSPSHVKDVQPVLPRQASRSVPNYLHVSGNMQPIPSNLQAPWSFSFVGNINTTTPLMWEGGCFKENEARLELHDKPGSLYGGGTVYLEVSQAKHWYCVDHYLFVTAARCEYDYFYKTRTHQVPFRKWKSQLEFEYVEKVGITLIMLPSSLGSKELRDM